jgi:hypothetical protein
VQGAVERVEGQAKQGEAQALQSRAVIAQKQGSVVTSVIAVPCFFYHFYYNQ